MADETAADRLVARLTAAFEESPEAWYELPEQADALAVYTAKIVRALGYVETIELAGQFAVIEARGDDDDQRAAGLVSAGAAGVAFLAPGETIEALSEEQMREAGWERIQPEEEQG